MPFFCIYEKCARLHYQKRLAYSNEFSCFFPGWLLLHFSFIILRQTFFRSFQLTVFVFTFAASLSSRVSFFYALWSTVCVCTTPHIYLSFEFFFISRRLYFPKMLVKRHYDDSTFILWTVLMDFRLLSLKIQIHD